MHFGRKSIGSMIHCLKSVLVFVLASMAIPQIVMAQDDPPSFLDQLKKAVAGAVNGIQETDTKLGLDAAVTWHPTLEAAIDDARESGKPIFAVVGAPWCGFCEKLQQELKGAAEAKIAEKWVLAKINADNEVNDAHELRADASLRCGCFPPTES